MTSWKEDSKIISFYSLICFLFRDKTSIAMTCCNVSIQYNSNRFKSWKIDAWGEERDIESVVLLAWHRLLPWCLCVTAWYNHYIPHGTVLKTSRGSGRCSHFKALKTENVNFAENHGKYIFQAGNLTLKIHHLYIMSHIIACCTLYLFCKFIMLIIINQ